MRNYLVRRLLLFIPTLFLVSVIIFVIIRVVPGDPALAILGESQYTMEEYLSIRAMMGLDKPIFVQYWDWISGIMLRFDFGQAIRNNVPVAAELKNRFPLSMEIAVLTMLISLSIALPVGVFSALKQDTWGDYLARSFSILGLSIPTFWLGTLTVLILSRGFQYLPSLIYSPLWEDPGANLSALIWPALGLGFYMNATVARMTRAQMLEVMRQDYIRTAWSKGLQTRAVIIRHALKNAALPVITITGAQVGLLLGGSVIMETIFNLPGLGRLFIDSVGHRDYPMIQGLTLFFASIYLVVNLTVDLLYGWLDPRIRYQ